MSEILPNLFLGNWEDSEDFSFLNKNNIKCIITLETTPRDEKILDYYKANNIKNHFFHAYDHPDEKIERYFEPTRKIINSYLQKDEPILVHCMAGISRSATIILAYLIPLLGFEKAYALVKSKRNIINPNRGFLFKLKNNIFLKENKMNDQVYAPDFEKDTIPLKDLDFDVDGTLKLYPEKVVIMFYSDMCGHCNNMKQDYARFATVGNKTPGMKICKVDVRNNPTLMNRINPKAWGFQAKGVPTIVSYNNKKFFSEYAPSGDGKMFRKLEDLVEYAKGVGTATVEKV